MIEPLASASALLAGACLGAIFYGGLWWTVRKIATSGQPAILVLGSQLARTIVVVAGFYYFISQRRWELYAPCALGFVIARYTVTWVTRQYAIVDLSTLREADHAHLPG